MGKLNEELVLNVGMKDELSAPLEKTLKNAVNSVLESQKKIEVAEKKSNAKFVNDIEKNFKTLSVLYDFSEEGEEFNTTDNVNYLNAFYSLQEFKKKGLLSSTQSSELDMYSELVSDDFIKPIKEMADEISNQAEEDKKGFILALLKKYQEFNSMSPGEFKKKNPGVDYYKFGEKIINDIAKLGGVHGQDDIYALEDHIIDSFESESIDLEKLGVEIFPKIFEEKINTDPITNSFDKIKESVEELDSVPVKSVIEKYKELIELFKLEGVSFKNFTNGSMTLSDNMSNINSGKIKDFIDNNNIKDSIYNGKFIGNEVQGGAGNTHSGVLSTKDVTVIARASHYLPKIQNLKAKIDQAVADGAKAGQILDIIEDLDNGLIYDIQSTAPGENIGKTTEWLEATDEELLKLLDDFEIFKKNDLGMDILYGDNINYKKGVGFTTFDFFSGADHDGAPQDKKGVIKALKKYANKVTFDDDIKNEFFDRLDNIYNISMSETKTILSSSSKDKSTSDKNLSKMDKIKQKISESIDGAYEEIDEETGQLVVYYSNIEKMINGIVTDTGKYKKHKIKMYHGGPDATAEDNPFAFYTTNPKVANKYAEVTNGDVYESFVDASDALILDVKGHQWNHINAADAFNKAYDPLDEVDEIIQKFISGKIEAYTDEFGNYINKNINDLHIHDTYTDALNSVINSTDYNAVILDNINDTLAAKDSSVIGSNIQVSDKSLISDSQIVDSEELKGMVSDTEKYMTETQKKMKYAEEFFQLVRGYYSSAYGGGEIDLADEDIKKINKKKEIADIGNKFVKQYHGEGFIFDAETYFDQLALDKYTNHGVKKNLLLSPDVITEFSKGFVSGLLELAEEADDEINSIVSNVDEKINMASKKISDIVYAFHNIHDALDHSQGVWGPSPEDYEEDSKLYAESLKDISDITQIPAHDLAEVLSDIPKEEFGIKEVKDKIKDMLSTGIIKTQKSIEAVYEEKIYDSVEEMIVDMIKGVSKKYLINNVYHSANISSNSLGMSKNPFTFSTNNPSTADTYGGAEFFSQTIDVTDALVLDAKGDPYSKLEYSLENVLYDGLGKADKLLELLLKGHIKTYIDQYGNVISKNLHSNAGSNGKVKVDTDDLNSFADKVGYSKILVVNVLDSIWGGGDLATNIQTVKNSGAIVSGYSMDKLDKSDVLSNFSSSDSYVEVDKIKALLHAEQEEEENEINELYNIKSIIGSLMTDYYQSLLWLQKAKELGAPASSIHEHEENLIELKEEAYATGHNFPNLEEGFNVIDYLFNIEQDKFSPNELDTVIKKATDLNSFFETINPMTGEVFSVNDSIKYLLSEFGYEYSDFNNFNSNADSVSFMKDLELFLKLNDKNGTKLVDFMRIFSMNQDKYSDISIADYAEKLASLHVTGKQGSSNFLIDPESGYVNSIKDDSSEILLSSFNKALNMADTYFLGYDYEGIGNTDSYFNYLNSLTNMVMDKLLSESKISKIDANSIIDSVETALNNNGLGLIGVFDEVGHLTGNKPNNEELTLAGDFEGFEDFELIDEFDFSHDEIDHLIDLSENLENEKKDIASKIDNEKLTLVDSFEDDDFEPIDDFYAYLDDEVDNLGELSENLENEKKDITSKIDETLTKDKKSLKDDSMFQEEPLSDLPNELNELDDLLDNDSAIEQKNKIQNEQTVDLSNLEGIESFLTKENALLNEKNDKLSNVNSNMEIFENNIKSLSDNISVENDSLSKENSLLNDKSSIMSSVAGVLSDFTSKIANASNNVDTLGSRVYDAKECIGDLSANINNTNLDKLNNISISFTGIEDALSFKEKIESASSEIQIFLDKVDKINKLKLDNDLGKIDIDLSIPNLENQYNNFDDIITKISTALGALSNYNGNDFKSIKSFFKGLESIDWSKIKISNTVPKRLSDIVLSTQYADKNNFNAIKSFLKSLNNIGDMSNVAKNLKNISIALKDIVTQIQDSGVQTALKDLSNTVQVLQKAGKNTINAANNKNKSKTDLNSAINKYKSMQQKLDKLLNGSAITYSPKSQLEIKAKIKDIKDTINAYENQGFLTDSDKDKINSDMLSLQKFYEEIKKNGKIVINTQWTTTLKKIGQLLNDNTSYSKNAREQLEKLYEEVSGGNITSSRLSAINSEINTIIASEERAGRSGDSWFKKMTHRLDDMNQKFLAQYFSWMDIIRYVRELSQQVIDVDTALTELRKVSDVSTTRLQQNFTKSTETAKGLGATITDVINSTSDWSRAGFNIDEAEELARVSTLYQNVAENLSAEQANEYLVSTLRGFQMNANEAERIVDSVNEVANNFSIDSSGIGESLQRSAAVFNQANTDLNESIALVTGANEVVQDPEKVGTAWKTISARIRSSKIELEELGEDTEDMVDSTAELQKYLKQIAGVDILESDGKTFRSLYDIIVDLGEAWSGLDEATRQGVLQKLAGKTQLNVLASTLQNIDRVKEAYQTAEGSFGSAAEEQERYSESIQFSINQIKASAQEFANVLIKSGLIKELIDFGREGLEIITKIVDKSGGIKNIIATIATLNVGKGLITGKSVGLDIITQLIEMGNNFNKGKGQTGGVSGVFDGLSSVISNMEGVKSLTEVLSKTKLVSNIQSATSGSRGISKVLMGIGGAIASINWPLVLITGSIAAVTTAIITFKKAHDNLIKGTKEAISSFQTESKEIDSYRSRVEQLQEVIHNSDSSYEEVTQARKDLLAVQHEMIDIYQDESGSISNVTAAINDQAGAWDRLRAAKWQETKNAINRGDYDNDGERDTKWYDRMWNTVRRGITGSEDNLTLANRDFNEYRAKSFDLSNTVLHKNNLDKTEVEKILKTTGASIKDTGWALQINIDGNAEEFYKTVINVQKVLDDLNVDSLDKKLAKAANKSKSILENTKDIALETIFNDKIYGSGYFDTYKQIEDQYKQYQDTLASGSEDEIKQAEKEFSEFMSKTLWDTSDEDVRYFFETMIPEIQTLFDNYEFRVNLVPKIDTSTGTNLSDYTEDDVREWLTTEGIQEGEEVYNRYVEAYKEAYGITKDTEVPHEEIIAYLIEEGKLQKALTTEAEKTAQAEYNIIDEVSGITKRIKPQFDTLGEAYNAIFNGENGFDLSPKVVNADLKQSIIDSFTGLSEDLGIDFPTDEVNAFLDVLSSSSSTSDDVQNAFNEIASSYFYTAKGLKNLNAETKESIIADLKHLNVVNAEEVVNAGLIDQYRQLEIELVKTQFDELGLKNVSAEMAGEQAYAAAKMMNLADASEYAKLSFIQCMNSAVDFNNKKIDPSDKIKAFKEIAAAAGDAGYQMRLAINLQNAQNSKKYKKANDEQKNEYIDTAVALTQVGYALEQEKLRQETMKITLGDTGVGNITKGSGSGGSGGSSDSSKDTAETFDWVEVRLTRIQEFIDRIKKKADTTWNSWKTRNGALEWQIKTLKEQEDALNKAAKTYQDKADSVGLSSEWVEKIKSGAFAIDEITDEALKEKIQSYQEWYNKAVSAITEAEEKHIERVEARLQRFNNIVTKAEATVGLRDARLTGKRTVYEGYANRRWTTDNEIDSFYNASDKTLKKNAKTTRKEIKGLEKQLKLLRKSGVKKNSEEWSNLKKQIVEAKNSVKEYKNELKDNRIARAQAKIDRITGKFDEREASRNTGKTVRDSIYNGVKGRQDIGNDFISQYYSATNQVLTQHINDTQSVISGLRKQASKLPKKSKAYTEVMQKIADYNADIIQTQQEILDNNIKAAQEMFENVQVAYEREISLLDTRRQGLDTALSINSARGYTATKGFYDIELNNASQRQMAAFNKAQAMRAQLEANVASGTLSLNTPEYWTELQAVLSVENEVLSIENEIIETKEAQRKLDIERANREDEFISKLHEEYSLIKDYITMRDRHVTDEDTGIMTSSGRAQLVTLVADRETVLGELERAQQRRDSAKATWDNDPRNQILQDEYNTLNDRVNQLFGDAIQKTEEIRSFWNTVFDGMLSALKKLTDKRKEQLDLEKDAYDYQNNVEDQAKTITNLEKQLAAFGADDSEEGKARLLRINDDLEAAKKALEETEYEKAISEQTKAMDNMYDEYEDFLNSKLDDIDALLELSAINTAQSDEATRQTLREAEASLGGVYMEQADKIINSITGPREGSTIAGVIEETGNLSHSVNDPMNGIISIGATVKQILDAMGTIGFDNNTNSSPVPTSTGGNDSGNNSNTNNSPAVNVNSSGGLDFGEGLAFHDKMNKLVQATKKNVDIWLLAAKQNHGEKKRNKKSTNSIVDYLGIGEKLSEAERNNLLNILGVKTPSAAVSKLKGMGYAKGGMIDFVHKAGEDGIAMVRHGEYILTPDMLSDALGVTNSLLSIMNSDFVKALNSNVSSSLSTNNSIGDVTMNITLPNVTNYDEFKREIIRDKDMERFVQEVSVGRMLGNNSLGKYKI